jgi:hypothetical protein
VPSRKPTKYSVKRNPENEAKTAPFRVATPRISAAEREYFSVFGRGVVGRYLWKIENRLSTWGRIEKYSVATSRNILSFDIGGGYLTPNGVEPSDPHASVVGEKIMRTGKYEAVRVGSPRFSGTKFTTQSITKFVTMSIPSAGRLTNWAW